MSRGSIELGLTDHPALQRVLDGLGELFICDSISGGDVEQGAEWRRQRESITLLNVNFANASAAMLSVPRDLYVPLPNLAGVGIANRFYN